MLRKLLLFTLFVSSAFINGMFREKVRSAHQVPWRAMSYRPSEKGPSEEELKKYEETRKKSIKDKIESKQLSAQKLGELLMYEVQDDGDLSIIQDLIKSGADVNVEDRGRTPLHIACYSNKAASLVKALLAAPTIDVNVQDIEGRTPLHDAVLKGDEGIVRALLAVPTINVNLQDKRGSTPLHYAASEDEGIARALLAVPTINVNLQDKGGSTPLHNASRRDEGIVRALLEIPSIEVNVQDCYGSTPLHNAVSLKREDVMKALLAVPTIKVNTKNNYGNTPLHQVVSSSVYSHNYESIMKVLLAVPAIEVNAENNDGQSLLHLAARGSGLAGIKYEGIVKALLAVPSIKVNGKDKHGWTPWQFAVQSGDINTIKMFLEYAEINSNKLDNAKPESLFLSNFQDSRVEEILRYAAQYGYEKVVRSILAIHDRAVNSLDDLAAPTIDINAQSKEGYTPLHLAAQNGHETIVKALLAAPGINVNALNKEKSTALFLATAQGYEGIVKAFLAIPDIDSTSTQTALVDVAVNKGYERIVKALLATPGMCIGTDSLSLAVKMEKWSFVQLLLRHGALLSPADHNNVIPALKKLFSTHPLFLASVLGSVDQVKALATEQTHSGLLQKALLYAIGQRHIPVIEYLVPLLVKREAKDFIHQEALFHVQLLSTYTMTKAEEQRYQEKLKNSIEKLEMGIKKLKSEMETIERMNALGKGELFGGDGEGLFKESSEKKKDPRLKLIQSKLELLKQEKHNQDKLYQDIGKLKRQEQYKHIEQLLIDLVPLIQKIHEEPQIKASLLERDMPSVSSSIEKQSIQESPAVGSSTLTAITKTDLLPTKSVQSDRENFQNKSQSQVPLISTSQESANLRLLQAAQQGDVREVQRALADGADIQAQNSNRETALWLAASWGHKAIVQALLAVPHSDVNAHNNHGATPLHIAVWHGHNPVVQVLLAQPLIKINLQDQWGQAPLHRALEKKRLDSIRMLLQHGAQLNVFDSLVIEIIQEILGKQELLLASVLGNYTTVKAMATAQTSYLVLQEALMLAIGQGHGHIVEYLIPLIINQGASNFLEVTALRHVIVLLERAQAYGGEEDRYKYIEHVLREHTKSIRTHKAFQAEPRSSQEKAENFASSPAVSKSNNQDNKDAKNCTICLEEYQQGEKLMALPCGHVFHPHCVSTVIKSGSRCPLCRGVPAQLDAAMFDAQLLTAVAMGDVEQVRQALKQGASLNAKNQQGKTSMHIAATFGYTDVVHALLTLADINSINGLEQSLQSAVKKGHTAIVRLLLNYGALVDNTDPILIETLGTILDNPLQLAAIKGDVNEVKRLLLEKQVELSVLQEALLFAVSQGHVPVVRYLALFFTLRRKNAFLKQDPVHRARLLSARSQDKEQKELYNRIEQLLNASSPITARPIASEELSGL